MSNKEDEQLDRVLDSYLNRGETCECGCVDFKQVDGYTVACCDCEKEVDIFDCYCDSQYED